MKIHSAIGNAIETIYASNLAPWYSRLVRLCVCVRYVYASNIDWFPVYVYVPLHSINLYLGRGLYSLAYHYALGEGTRAKAFNFCLLAAEEACAKEAYADALLFCMNAQSIAINRTEMRLELNTVHQIIADMEIVKSSKNQQLKTGNPYLDLLSSMVAGSGLSFMSNKESNMNKKILQNIFEAFCNLRDSLENDIQQATRRYNDDSKLSVSGFPSFYRSKSSVYEADNGEPSFTARCDTSYGGGPGPNGGTGLPFSPPAVTTEAFSSASLSQNCRKQWDPSVLSATALAIATSPTGHGVSIFSQANAISTSGGNASPKKSSAHSIAQGLTNLIKNSTDIIRRGRSRGGSVCSEDDDEGNCAASRSGSNSRSRSGSGASATKSKPIPVPLSNAMRGGRNSPSIYRSDSCAASPALSSQSGSPAVVDVGDSWSCLKTPSPLPNSPPKGASVYPF